MGSTAGPATGNLFFTLWIIDYCNFSHYSMESSSISIVWLLTLLTNCYNPKHCAGGAKVLCLLPIFPSAMNLTRTNLSFLASQLWWWSKTCLSLLPSCDCIGGANLLCLLPIFASALNLTSINFPLWRRSKSALPPLNLRFCNESYQH